MSDRMRGFRGFSEGKARLTPIPDQFFEELLPAIDDLAELKVTLHIMWRAAARSDRYRYVRRVELEADQRLLGGLPHPGMTPSEALQQALEMGVARGTLLRVSDSNGTPDQEYYFLNSARGREAIQAIEAGEWVPGAAASGETLESERPNIYRLYEQNIGMLTPLIAETLQEAGARYPLEWIQDAMRIAVANNARSWRYIEAILDEWEAKGRNEREDRRDPETARRKYTGGKFSEFIEH